MKTKYILFCFMAVALTSCTAIYKSGQTPDDVYYSPARVAGEGSSDNSGNNDYVQSQPSGNYYSSEDRAIRMGISDSRWRSLDNDYYGSGFGYSPYSFSLNMGLGSGYYNNYGYYGGLSGPSYFDPYHSNLYYDNYYYNPYYNAYPIYVLPATPLRNSTPRTTNLTGYGRNYNNTNGNYPLTTPARSYNNSNTNRTSSGLGSILNRVLVPATNNANYNTAPTSNTTRTYTPPASQSSSSSGSGSSGGSRGGGSVSRPH